MNDHIETPDTDDVEGHFQGIDAEGRATVPQPTRVAVTGRTASPGLFEVLELLGRERTLRRLASAAILASE